MATYDYKCESCGNKVEVLKPISEKDTKEKCPSCDAVMKKEITAPAFHLKGTGWYVTDYPKDKAGKKDEPTT